MPHDDGDAADAVDVDHVEAAVGLGVRDVRDARGDAVEVLEGEVDAGVEKQETVYVSGGRRGLDIALAPGDLARLTGIEIGPLDKPLVRRDRGPVLYVDHADTAALRRKYADDPGVDLDALVEVDAGGASLLSRVTPDAAARLGLAPGVQIVALFKSVGVEVS